MIGVARARAALLPLFVACVVQYGCAAVAPTPTPAPAIELRALTDTVWLHTSYYTYPGGTRFPSNGLLVREGEALTLIDTAWGELATVALLEVIEQQVGLPVTGAVITHSHGDRIAGADVLESRGIAVQAHPLTRRLAIRSGVAVPDGVLEGIERPGAAVRHGALEIYYPGAGHSADNIVVWLAEQRVLFGGCAVRAAASATAGNTADADLDGWLSALANIAVRYGSAVQVIPGHGEPGGPELLEHTATLVRAARD